ncbi:ABC transporter permease [Dermatophilus congolensis]|uniref:ABC transporter permease n=1 Tax=Dermatophilus congolensis TaxID=1863 RepID=UPI001AAF6C6E|nr:ABC transporter permease [Dermatophilus congolensis]MBO3130376.1 ABC transporter permease [Dermatophilus congolensis]MBO3130993.1 ABC transporter permease [Dermatophilus congolensis]MBO3134847.1 ABC transporter permease [Dermatophilus congolensis]MBO3137084.1 ABC transporter permease [Dermatophilus congolensis]MBO3139328.1 ABC transporter permease [Dermatophilus congolensis]
MKNESLPRAEFREPEGAAPQPADDVPVAGLSHDGLLLGARSNNPALIGTLAGFVSPGLLFLCGVFLPYRMMPGWVEAIGLALPFTYIADMLRFGLTGISPSYSFLTGVLVSLVWAVAMFVAAFVIFRWDGR